MSSLCSNHMNGTHSSRPVTKDPHEKIFCLHILAAVGLVLFCTKYMSFLKQPPQNPPWLAV